MQNKDIFGATALHRRRPFKDPATLSRSIVIKTKKTKVDAYLAEEFAEFAPVLADIAKHVTWNRVPEHGGDRIADTWAPLLVVNELFGGDWESYANGQIKAAQDNLDLGHETEPSQAVYKAFLSLAIGDDGKVLDRVPPGSIAKALSDEDILSSYQVGVTLHDLGFVKMNRGGQAYIVTGGRDNLIAIGRGLGIEDEWFDEAEAEEGMKIYKGCRPAP